MKAMRVDATAKGTGSISPLAFPSVHRTGVSDPEIYRKRARGEAPPPTHQLTPCGPLHAIRLDPGPVENFASQPGALLTVIASGQLHMASISGDSAMLESGDLLLVDEAAVAGTTFTAKEGCRLIQIGVNADWPQDQGQDHGPGTIVPRPGAVNFKRMYTDEEQRSRFNEFAELFAALPGEWTAGKSMEGFRFLSWEDGLLDWHPGVINQLAIFLSGTTEVVVGGGGGDTQYFYAGDVCLGEDRTGEGHVDRVHGLAHIILLVVANEHLW
ncbi:hypothetical protein [Sphingobium sp. EM0848]|uniref:hypothetical protein n=1 Tax=Sphingobium sp. EM0848 TaxID=2743473 RepID=UPI00159C3150|nr:hypothetical protein [Sphingobium sp. EM0848]